MARCDKSRERAAWPSHHFDIFSAHLRSRPAGSPWSVWCSAASTGEEPYSIVMTAMEALGNNPSFKLTASDIDSRVLATAAQGVYRLESIKGLSQERLQRFFLRGKGSNAGMVRVKPELGRMIDFISVNLIRDDWPFREPFDVVFCRNVMIYFDGPTQRRVLERIHRVLKPGACCLWGMQRTSVSPAIFSPCEARRSMSAVKCRNYCPVHYFL
jgi:chemotaxis protein methyltransferase CheR